MPTTPEQETPRLLDHGREVARGVAAIDRAAALLRDGELVALPTDTVYGLAASMAHPAALDRVFAVKGRPPGRSLPILIATDADAAGLVELPTLDPRYRQLLDLALAHWPGGLTVAVPARAGMPAAVLAADGTVGLRVPADDDARAVIRAAGGALAVTSANTSGAETPAEASEIARVLGSAPTPLRWVLDGGPRPGGTPSTVIGLDGGDLVVHREGAVPADRLRDAWAAVTGREPRR